MEERREESCTGASSCTTDSDDSSICDLYHRKEVKRASRRCPTSSLSLLQRRFSFLSCIIVFFALEGEGIRNRALGFAAGAAITLPVIRSFSKMEGSGTAEGESGGMTREHYQQLRDHDQKRGLRQHGRVLASTTTIADFPLAGNDYDIGLYYTEIGLGTPSNIYFVQVDTGSDLLWVNCKPCPDCPNSTDLGVELRLYDPGSSSTSSNTSCSSSACSASATIGGDSCVDSSCYYAFRYGDGSTAMGYLVEDTMTYDTGLIANNTMSIAYANIVIGCGFNQTGDSLTSSSRATDGIMGFGREPLSVVVQLANAGKTTKMFAHCLQGDTGEGGIFVIGEVHEPGIMYTGLVAEQSHYNVVLQNISLGGTTLPVSSSVFDISGINSGTIFDSGTTLALLVDEAYDAFEQQLISVVTPTTFIQNSPCFQDRNGDLSSFPNLILNFEGASMELGPTNYLFRQPAGSSYLWCLGWSRSSDSDLPGLTILGDIVLKNKLVIYDLRDSKIGWVNYNCQSSVNVISGTGQQVNIGSSNSASRPRLSHHWTAVLIYSVVLIYAAAFL